MTRLSRLILAAVILCCSGARAAGDLPPGLSFIGLKERLWRVYVVDRAGALQEVATAQEPRAASVSLTGARIVYVSADGDLRSASLRGGDERILIPRSKERAMAQPVLAPDGATVFAVEMKQGTSADTDILQLRLAGGPPRAVVSQPGAQFEPSLARGGRYLLYSSVSCVLGCGRIVQEIWRKDLLGGEAVQLTLLNAIARQPFATADATTIYFSSDKAGNFHVWRMGADGSAPTPVTSGAVTDSNPVADAQGRVYFVRHDATGVKFMRLEPGGNDTPLALPGGVEDIRDLEIAQ
jgi:Tol biopolymer transport system component